jgi:hypothetical protein
MLRLLVRPALALLTFCLGVAAWFIILPAPSIDEQAAPLRVRVISVEKESPVIAGRRGNFCFYRYKVSVENVSGRVVRGYALDSETLTRPSSTAHVFPDVDLQTLRPGESRVETLEHALPADAGTEGLRLTLEFVNFADGTTWGPKQEYNDFFIRG